MASYTICVFHGCKEEVSAYSIQYAFCYKHKRNRDQVLNKLPQRTNTHIPSKKKVFCLVGNYSRSIASPNN